ncbi:hypothetical protein PG993_010462 [Apiospora rasikravindrae]|uniref:Heterokaryon incompatibility domain-containing protein n=1 Tax=Apiospora rasikravindrae TaxID=990691 RepID=A0ABR1SMM3_9PEZI
MARFLETLRGHIFQPNIPSGAIPTPSSLAAKKSTIAMWLIDTRTGGLVFTVNPVPGTYVILSHTWGAAEEEVSFQDFQRPDLANLGTKARGFAKIERTCAIARSRNLDFAWIDTCCIDKTSSAELSEAINSMFQWYKDADFCIAYLQDLPPETDSTPLESEFPEVQVEFYDESWEFRGLKSTPDMTRLLAKVTGIDAEILVDNTDLDKVPIARRFSWSSHRITTRFEDEAYCLLGLFNVHMPMIYGEGRKAFLRLQEEIAKDSGDLSLLAWTTSANDDGDVNCEDHAQEQRYHGIFAPSPLYFRSARNIKHRIRGFCVEKEFVVTNRGLKIETALVMDESGNVVLNLGVSHRDNWGPTNSDGWKGIFLAKTADGYVRSRPWQLFTARYRRYLADAPPIIHIRKHVSPAESQRLERRFAGGIRVRTRSQIQKVAPIHLWDQTRRTFMHQGRGINAWVVIHLPDPTPKPNRSDSKVEAVRKGPARAIVACSTMGYEVGEPGQPVCTIWIEGQGAWRNALGFLETRTEIADYVAADYLTNLVAATQSTKLARVQSCPFFVDGEGNESVITASLNDGKIEGVRCYFLDVDVEVSTKPTPDTEMTET